MARVVDNVGHTSSTSAHRPGRPARPGRDRRPRGSRRPRSSRRRRSLRDVVLQSVARGPGDRFVVVTIPEGRPERVRIHGLDGTFQQGDRPAGPRHGRAASAGSGRTRDLLHVHVVHAPRPTVYPATTSHRPTSDGLPPAARRLRPVGLRDDAGLLREQGRHESADVPRREEGAEVGRANPTLLYGYGGFNVPMLPSFSVQNRIPWLESGGVYAQASTCAAAREYGEEWHKAGMLGEEAERLRRLRAAAEWLVANKVTSARRLAIVRRLERRPPRGRRPEPASGALRRGRSRGRRHGHAPLPEVHDRLGVDDRSTARRTTPKQFQLIYAYSPLHNIRKGAPIRRSSSRPPTTTTASSRRTRSSTRRRSRTRRAARRRS